MQQRKVDQFSGKIVALPRENETMLKVFISLKPVLVLRKQFFCLLRRFSG